MTPQECGAPGQQAPGSDPGDRGGHAGGSGAEIAEQLRETSEQLEVLSTELEKAKQQRRAPPAFAPVHD